MRHYLRKLLSATFRVDVPHAPFPGNRPVRLPVGVSSHFAWPEVPSALVSKVSSTERVLPWPVCWLGDSLKVCRSWLESGVLVQRAQDVGSAECA